MSKKYEMIQEKMEEIKDALSKDEYNDLLEKIKIFCKMILDLTGEEQELIKEKEEYKFFLNIIKYLIDTDNSIDFGKFDGTYDKTFILMFHFFDKTSLFDEQDCVLEFIDKKIDASSQFFNVIENDLRNLKKLSLSGRKQIQFKINENIVANLLTGCILIHKFDEELSDLEKINCLDMDKVNAILSYCIAINSGISVSLMEYEFQNDKELDLASNYIPNKALIDKCKLMKKHQGNIECIKEIKSEKINSDITWCENKLLAIYQKEINDGLDFIKIQAVLVIMEQSPFFSKVVRGIAKELLLTFKELLVNISVEQLVLENNINFSEEELGPKTSTKMELFFYLTNEDRYCLRFDFPHEGAEYIHYNVHEPLHVTGIPLKYIDFKSYLREICETDENIEYLFFQNENHYWFRCDFEKRINCIELKDKSHVQMLNELFVERCHYKCFSIEYTKQDVKEFLIDFVEGLYIMNVKQMKYKKINHIDIEGVFNTMLMYNIIKNILQEYSLLLLRQEIEIEQNDYSEYFEILRQNLVKGLIHISKGISYSKYQLENMNFKDIVELCFKIEER